MNRLLTGTTCLSLLFSLCFCSHKADKKIKVPVSAGQQLFLPGIGFIKGPVVRIDQLSNDEGTDFRETVYTVDYTSRQLTVTERETGSKEVYYLNGGYRPDSMVKEDKNGRHTTLFLQVPVYHNLVSSHLYGNRVADSISYTIDSTDRSAITITGISSTDSRRQTIYYFNEKRRYTGYVSRLQHSADSVTNSYEYDSSGTLLKLTQTGPSGGFIAISRILKSDKRANWLEMETVYYDGKGNRRGGSFIRRKITYAE